MQDYIKIIARPIKTRPPFAGVLAVLAIIMFVTLVAYSINLSLNWKTIARGDSQVITEGCRLAHKYSDDPIGLGRLKSLPLRSIEVPHKAKVFTRDTENKSDKGHLSAYYHCQIDIDRTRNNNNLTYLHLGYLIGSRHEVYLNGTLQTSFEGTRKVFLPIQNNIDSIKLEIYSLGKDTSQVGLTSLAEVLISDNESTNNRLFSISNLFSETLPLFKLLPTITMGLILSFAWLLGLRHTPVSLALSFIVLMAIRNMISIFYPFLPWDQVFSFSLNEPIYGTSLILVLILSANFFGFDGRPLRNTLIAVAMLFIVEIYLIFSSSNPYDLVDPIMYLNNYGIVLPVAVIVIMSGCRKITEKVIGADIRIIAYFNLSLVVFLACALIFDALSRQLNYTYKLIPYLDQIFPVLVGGSVIYLLYLVDSKLKLETEVRKRYEYDLSLAADIQSILFPTRNSGECFGYKYDFFFRPYGILGGDWAKSNITENKSIFIIGDVVGKGAPAALTHSGIAAAWEASLDLWQGGHLKSEDILNQINQIMIRLFKTKMNTTFAACEITSSGNIRICRAAQYWFKISNNKASVCKGMSLGLLGSHQTLEAQFSDIVLEKGDFLICFTDGILEGSRAISKFFNELELYSGKLTSDKLVEIATVVGQANALPDDGSVLVIEKLA